MFFFFSPIFLIDAHAALAQTQQERDKQLAFLDLEGRRKIDNEFEVKKKGLNVQKRIMKAKASQKEFGRKMHVRQDLINDMLKEASDKLSEFSRTADYKGIVLKLMVQALLKLQESTVKIRCRKQDVEIVSSLKGQAVKEFQKFMKSECGVSPKCEIVVDKKNFVDSKSYVFFSVSLSPTHTHTNATTTDPAYPECIGGHCVTFETRLRTAFSDLKPVLRAVLFPSSCASLKDDGTSK